MSSKARSGGLATGLLLLALVAGGIYVVNRSVVSNQGGSPVDTIPSGIPSTPTVSDTKPTTEEKPSFPPVLVMVAEDSTHRIVQRSGGDENTLFTDNGEQQKLLSVMGTNFADAVFAWVAPDPSAAIGRLATIAADGSGNVSTFESELPATSPPGVSADGNTVAYVGFDNAEGSFGFSLNVGSPRGGTAQVVDSSAEGIALPAWSPSGSLAYAVGQATPDKGVELKVRSGGTSTTRFTSSAKQAITDLTWLGNDRLAVVLEPLGNGAQNQASVAVITASDGKVVKTFDLPGKERSLRGTKDGQFLAVVSSELKDANTKATGKVTLIHIESGTEASQGNGTAVAGFLQ